MEITIESIEYKTDGEFAFKPKFMAHADIKKILIPTMHIDGATVENTKDYGWYEFNEKYEYRIIPFYNINGWFMAHQSGFPKNCVIKTNAVRKVKLILSEDWYSVVK